MEQDRNRSKKQACPYIQKNIMMNWQCCCPCMIEQSKVKQAIPYQNRYNNAIEDEDKSEEKDEDADVRVWKGPAKNYHKWNGDPMYGPGWYHHHWDGHNWNGPWHDKKPYNNGWYGNPKRDGEED